MARTRVRVSAVMRPWSFRALDAVATLTPEASATSRSVTGRLRAVLIVLSLASVMRGFLVAPAFRAADLLREKLFSTAEQKRRKEPIHRPVGLRKPFLKES